MSAAALRAYVDANVQSAPHLTPEQRDRILTILRPARVGDAR